MGDPEGFRFSLAEPLGPLSTAHRIAENETAASDRVLIRAALDGDVEAYGQLVSRHQALVLKAAILAGAGDAAQDAAQDAFVSAWQALPRFDQARRFRPWIVRIVTNGVRNRQRSHRRRCELLRECAARQEPPLVDSGEVAVIEADARKRLYEALSRLPERQRQAVVHRYLLQMSEQETAEALRLPAGTVKSRLSRALDRLRSDPVLTDLVDGG